MKALAVSPGTPHSAQLIDRPLPEARNGALLIKGLTIGICGSDAEIIEHGGGEAPAGEASLILGHESLGEVIEAPPGSGFAPGQLVAGIVRRPDPEPCDHCAIGEWDMCRNGGYRECGIKAEHGYAREHYLLEPQFAVAVDASLGELGVLMEPASVVIKACVQAAQFLQRTRVHARTALITGAGPIGLLAALASCSNGFDTCVVDIVEGGPKPELVKALGARYHAGSVRDLDISPEVVIDCTGIGSVLREAGAKASPGAIIALTGISASAGLSEVDLNVFNKNMVLNNKVLFGSVNAGRSHFELAAALLAQADPSWLRRLISRRVPFDHWPEALERQPDDVKVVLDISQPGSAL
jgi:threonine dehydrogenase-like Zn-dependent dehydrogenase